MRKVTGGNGQDTTAAVKAWLTAGHSLSLANLYLIGEPEDSMSIWLTDWESPLVWPCWGTFQPGVIKRGSVTAKIGFDVDALEITWSPRPAPLTASIATANPYQLAQIGYWDNWRVRVWTVYMPTPGDANTYGCSELFGGRIADSTCERGAIKWRVNSFLDVVKQQVPTNVIELLNTAAAYAGAVPPKDYRGPQIPNFMTVEGSSPTQVNAYCTDGDSVIFDDNAFQHGYLIFIAGEGATLGGVWSAIAQNTRVTIGDFDYNQFLLYAPLPWPPTAGVDAFYVSAAAPVNQADGEYYGFPYVPNSENAI